MGTMDRIDAAEARPRRCSTAITLIAALWASCSDPQFQTDAGAEPDAASPDAGSPAPDGGGTHDAEVDSSVDAARAEDAAQAAPQDAAQDAAAQDAAAQDAAAQDAAVDPGPVTVASVTSGATASCVVLSTGRAKRWGENTFGQIGDRTKEDRNRATDVVGLDNIKSIALGYRHACLGAASMRSSVSVISDQRGADAAKM